MGEVRLASSFDASPAFVFGESALRIHEVHEPAVEGHSGGCRGCPRIMPGMQRERADATA